MTARRPRRATRAKGCLTIVGLGIKGLAQITAEAMLAIENASIVFHAAADDATARWIAARSRRAQDLTSCFSGRRSFRAAHDAMVKQIVTALDRGGEVCAAFYGSPAVGVYPAHRALTLARKRGHHARMLPGVSSEACLFADLPLDPLASGCQSYEATDFLLRKPRFDPKSPLVLWQIGFVGGRMNPSARQTGLDRLGRLLRTAYGRTHKAALYVAGTSANSEGRFEWLELQQLPAASIPDEATLYVPAVERVPSSPRRTRQ